MLSTKKLEALRAKIKELQTRAKRIEKQNGKGVLEAAKLIRRYDLSMADLKQAWMFSKKHQPVTRSKKRRKIKKVAAKYADDKGNKWSGRGRLPLWLIAAEKTGKKREAFLLKPKVAKMLPHSVV